MNKKTEQYQITHNKIIDTVTEMMGSVAFEKITIRDICRKSDVSIGNFYHHFRNKEEILQMEYQQFDEILEKSFPDETLFSDAREKLLYLFERELSSIRDIGHYAATQIFRTQLLFEDPFILEQDRFFYKKLTAAVEEYLDEKNSAGTPQEFVEELLRVSRGSIYDWCLHHGNYDLVDTTLATIKKLLI